MKIVYIITRSDVMGGASVHLIDLALGAKQLGNDVVILVGGNGVFNRLADDRGLQCISLKYLVRKISIVKDVLAVFELNKILKIYNPDIVHLHSSKAGVVGRISCRIIGVPCIFTAHGWAFTDGVSKLKRFIYSRIEKFLSTLSSKIITVSDYDRKLALDLKVATNNSMVTVHNGIPDVSDIHHNEVSDSVLIVMVARFDRPKRQDFLVRVLSELKSLNWRLEFIGDGPDLETSKMLVQEFDLGDRVVFSGACNDVPQRLARSDIFVLVSDWEGLPLTIIEAMRAGLPVIASNVGGVNEIVEDSQSGYLINRGDSESLKCYLKMLINSHDLRCNLGQRGRELFGEKFTFQKMLYRTVEIYQSSLETKL